MIEFEEQFRPQFHFSPKENWMNDPNGLVFNDGVYHLFYQYYPKDTVWGSMHWGHAVSKDLISWEHRPIALFPDEHGDIFSGCVVLDTENTSGFGTKRKPPLVAIFTYHLMEGEKAGRNNYQTQGVAYSLDNGDTWVKYKKNPIISNSGIKDFRDPKVFWHDESKQWIMTLATGDHIKFYKSTNLIQWTHLSDFGKENGAHGGVWECPDLFKLKVDGVQEEKWVLLISINPGAPNGGSGTQYFIGNFDGTTFKVNHQDIKWIDQGADNYAGVTFSNLPNNKRIFIGWMNNWYYGEKIPTKTWRGAMVLPRELSLIQEDGVYFLRSNVISSFNNQISNVLERESINLENSFNLKNLNFNQTEIKFITNLSKKIHLEFRNRKDEFLTIAIDPQEKEIIVDRRKSGLTDFEKRFADGKHVMTYTVCDKEVDVKIILDWSSIEIFIDSGKYVMTEQIFPTEYYSLLQISSLDNSSIKKFKLNTVKSIWK